MKKAVIFFGLTIFLFVTITLSTAKIETPSDGNDTYGFPVTCFIRLSGMCEPCPPNPYLTEIYYWKLVVDILFAASLVAIGWTIFTKLKPVMKSKESEIL